jgi:hypothetical protein
LFDQRWLNKTAKMPDVQKEIDGKIADIYQNIKTLESISDYGMTAKALYLETLDMAQAMRQVNTMKENAERLAHEKAERAEREQREAIEANRAEQRAEAQEEERQKQSVAAVADMVTEALVGEANFGIPEPEAPAVEKPRLVECAMRFRGTKDALFELRDWMNNHGIVYERLEKEHYVS